METNGTILVTTTDDDNIKLTFFYNNEVEPQVYVIISKEVARNIAVKLLNA